MKERLFASAMTAVKVAPLANIPVNGALTSVEDVLNVIGKIELLANNGVRAIENFVQPKMLLVGAAVELPGHRLPVPYATLDLD